MERECDFTKENINDKKVYDYISTGETLGLFSDRISWNAGFSKEIKLANLKILLRCWSISSRVLWSPGM